MKLALIFTIIMSPWCFAEVYTWTNEKGVRVYGDEPPADAKKAKLPAIQKLKELKIPKDEKAKSNASPDGFEGYQQLNIVSPKEDAFITSGEAGHVTVQLQIQPSLQAHHEVTLLLDGKPIQTGAQLQFQIDNIPRGSHLLQVKIKHHGKLLISSPKRRIHIQRPSILNRPSSR